MWVRRLCISNFRNITDLELIFSQGKNVITGENGQGKTNIAEAIAWLSRASSFRGVSNESLIRVGCEQAIIRAEIFTGERITNIDIELNLVGRNRILVNKKSIKRIKDLMGYVICTVFGPDDLNLIKGSPSIRRNYLDDLLVAVDPNNYSLIQNFEKVLKQRNALLRQSGGRTSLNLSKSLDIWDAKLVSIGEDLGNKRKHISLLLEPKLLGIIEFLSAGRKNPKVEYKAPWMNIGLREELIESRMEDIRRGITTVGPHRDDLSLKLDSLATRTHVSQGEQRSCALGLRLGAHAVISENRGTDAVVILDDVFSELDKIRAEKLITILPDCQVVVTGVGDFPEKFVCESIFRIVAGNLA